MVQSQPSSRKEILIISRYYFPNVVVDSDAVYHMIAGLRQINSDIEITVLTTENFYKSQVKNTGLYSEELLNTVKVEKIQVPAFKSKSNIVRLFSNLYEGNKLARKAKSLNIRNVIALSNPPLISMWLSMLLFKKFNVFYWSFDLFPEAFVSDKILSDGSVIVRLFNYLTYRNSPDNIIALGDCQFDYLQKKFRTPVSKIILPCGIHKVSLSPVKPAWSNPNKIIIGYIGNIGRAHSIEFLLNMMTAISEQDNYILVIAAYGHHQEAVDAHIRGLSANNILTLPFIDKSELGYIDIHMVSLKSEWNNVSVPSKAVSAVCTGAALWFCGELESDTWTMFHTCGFKTSSNLSELKVVLDKIDAKVLDEKKYEARKIHSSLIATEKKAWHDINLKLK